MDKVGQLNDIDYQIKTVIKIHGDSVMNIIILKDRRIASSSCDNSIKIFNPNTFELEIDIKEHKDYVAYIYQLKNGKLISSSSDTTIKIFKLFKKDYTVEQILNGHIKPVKKTIELINEYLLSCSWDKSIIIWEKNNENKYIVKKKLSEKREIQSIFELNDKEFISISANDNNNVDDRAISFYKLENGKFNFIKIIENIKISGFQSNTIKINKNYILIGGKSIIYIIDIITYSINNIYELDKGIWIQSLNLLSNGNLIAGGHFDLMIFKINDNNLELVLDLKNILKDKEYSYRTVSTIIEDSNKNIIVSSYDGKIRVFSKKNKNKYLLKN